jgi:anthranilate synthase component II
MKILVFDNYDSFTYNLVHLVEKITDIKPDVFRNNEITLDAVGAYDAIILSPGPGIPNEAGLLLPLIKQYASSKKILGVCLGHQAIGEAFGASLINLEQVYHGVATTMKQTANQSVLFNGLPTEFEAGRYHSWIIDAATLSTDFEVTAVDENNFIMAMQHKQYNLQSVQFHPESVLTPQGEQMLRNWFNN